VDRPLTRRSLLAATLAAACSRARPVPTLAGPAWSVQARPLGRDFHRGMNLAHLHQRGWGYGSRRAATQLDRLRALGVGHIALNPFAYVSSLGATDIRWGGDATMTDEDLTAQVAQCTARDMRVMMKPHLWSWQFINGSGNGDIELDEAGWEAWFASYTKYAVHYATLAQASGCESLCVGLEYTGATRANPGRWADVAGACRGVFGGKLLYAANWYEEYEQFRDWAAFDYVGVNAYFPLKGTTVEELAASWAEHLDRIERVAAGRPVLFPEAGYRAVSGATEHPWEGSGGADPDLQGRAYEALLRACSQRPWFKGIYWWKWFTDLPGEQDPYVPADMPAEGVMKAWYTA
jgi:hypothetical protein